MRGALILGRLGQRLVATVSWGLIWFDMIYQKTKSQGSASRFPDSMRLLWWCRGAAPLHPIHLDTLLRAACPYSDLIYYHELKGQAPVWAAKHLYQDNKKQAEILHRILL